MQRRTLIILIAAVIGASARAQGLRDRGAIADAEGCATTFITGCNVTTRGQLAAGDCTFSDATRYDRFAVSLPPNRSVAVTLRPLVASYTNPWLSVIPPLNDGATPPVVYGPTAATVWVQTGATGGTWIVLAGTLDLFATGAYALHIDCFSLESAPRDCVTQELLCGHHAEATLTGESCRFTTVNRAYGNWSFYGRAGDIVILEMQSLAFEPLFGLYDDNNSLLRFSQKANSFTASMQYFVERTGWYSVAATSTLDNRGGDYDLSIRCTTSGCLFPYLRTNIPNFTVDRGKQAGIDLDLSVVGPFTSALVDGITTFASSTTTHLATPAIFAKQQFIAKIDTPCGTEESNIFSVEPRPTKLRSARH